MEIPQNNKFFAKKSEKITENSFEKNNKSSSKQIKDELILLEKKTQKLENDLQKKFNNFSKEFEELKNEINRTKLETKEKIEELEKNDNYNNDRWELNFKDEEKIYQSGNSFFN